MIKVYYSIFFSIMFFSASVSAQSWFDEISKNVSSNVQKATTYSSQKISSFSSKSVNRVNTYINSPEKQKLYRERALNTFSNVSLEVIRKVPIYDVKSGRVVAFDAYMRSFSEDLGMSGTLTEDPVGITFMMMVDSDYMLEEVQLIADHSTGEWSSINEAEETKNTKNAKIASNNMQYYLQQGDAVGFEKELSDFQLAIQMENFTPPSKNNVFVADISNVEQCSPRTFQYKQGDEIKYMLKVNNPEMVKGLFDITLYRKPIKGGSRDVAIVEDIKVDPRNSCVTGRFVPPAYIDKKYEYYLQIGYNQDRVSTSLGGSRTFFTEDHLEYKKSYQLRYGLNIKEENVPLVMIPKAADCKKVKEEDITFLSDKMSPNEFENNQLAIFLNNIDSKDFGKEIRVEAKNVFTGTLYAFPLDQQNSCYCFRSNIEMRRLQPGKTVSLKVYNPISDQTFLEKEIEIVSPSDRVSIEFSPRLSNYLTQDKFEVFVDGLNKSDLSSGNYRFLIQNSDHSLRTGGTLNNELMYVNFHGLPNGRYHYYLYYKNQAESFKSVDYQVRESYDYKFLDKSYKPRLEIAFDKNNPIKFNGDSRSSKDKKSYKKEINKPYKSSQSIQFRIVFPDIDPQLNGEDFLIFVKEWFELDFEMSGKNSNNYDLTYELKDSEIVAMIDLKKNQITNSTKSIHIIGGFGWKKRRFQMRFENKKLTQIDIWH